MQALHDVVKAGYVRYIEMSSCYAYRFHAMQNYAISYNLTPFISMQNHYNLVYREEEREMLPTLKVCQLESYDFRRGTMFGVGAIPWSPLARGILTRPLNVTTKRSESDAFFGLYKDIPKEVVTRVEDLAKKKGVSMAQISTAWISAKDGVTAPIVGTTNLKNLEDLIAAVNVTPSEDEIRYLEELYRPSPILGHS